MKMAARKPATSVRIPPPKATMTLDRSPPARDHLLGQRLHFRQTLARFAAGEKQDLGFANAKRRRERLAVQLPNVFG